MPKPFVKGDPRAGRPKGAKNKKTIELEQAQKVLQQMILENIKPLAIAAINSARGEQVMFKTMPGSVKPIQVRDPEEIAEALAAMGQDGMSVIGKSIYMITTSSSDTRAFQELMNRAFGKPKETVDMNVKGQLSLIELAQYRAQLDKTDAQKRDIRPAK